MSLLLILKDQKGQFVEALDRPKRIRVIHSLPTDNRDGIGLALVKSMVLRGLIAFVLLSLSQSVFAALACPQVFKPRYLEYISSPIKGYFAIRRKDAKKVYGMAKVFVRVSQKMAEHQNLPPYLISDSQGVLYRRVDSENMNLNGFLLSDRFTEVEKEAAIRRFVKLRKIYLRAVLSELPGIEVVTKREYPSEYLRGRYIENESFYIEAMDLMMVVTFKHANIDLKTKEVTIRFPVFDKISNGRNFNITIFLISEFKINGERPDLEMHEGDFQAQRRNDRQVVWDREQRQNENSIRRLKQKIASQTNRFEQLLEQCQKLGVYFEGQLIEKLGDQPIESVFARHGPKLSEVTSKKIEKGILDAEVMKALNETLYRIRHRDSEIRQSTHDLILAVIGGLGKKGFLTESEVQKVQRVLMGISLEKNPVLADVRSFLVHIESLNKIYSTSRSPSEIEVLSQKLNFYRSFVKSLNKRLSRIADEKNLVSLSLPAFNPENKSSRPLSEYETMQGLERDYDLLARKVVVTEKFSYLRKYEPSKLKPINEVDNAFIDGNRGVPEVFLGVSRQGHLDFEFPLYFKAFSIGHQGALNFGALFHKENATRYYAVLFKKGFVKHYGTEVQFSSKRHTAENLIVGRGDRGGDKAFVIAYEKATQDQGQVHIYPTWSNLMINGRTQTHADFFRSHALGVVEFNERGEILAVREF